MSSSAVLIASSVPLDGIGGLAQYQRILLEELNSPGRPGAEFAFLPDSGTENRTPGARGKDQGAINLNSLSWRLCLKLFPRLSSRRIFIPLLERWLCSLASSIDHHFLPIGCRVIHFVGTGWNIHGFWLAALARRRSLEFSVLPAVHPESWGDDTIDIRLYRRADTVFCLSQSEVDHLARKGVPRGVLAQTTLPPVCPLDGQSERLRKKLGCGDRLLVLFIGRRDAGKGYSALLEAWPTVVKAIPSAALLLAGPGEGDSDRQRRIAAEEIYDLGIPDEQTKADALAACNVFCLPSAHESYGLVYVEAWAYEKAVICGTAPASRELVTNGVTGLWTTQEPTDLAETICRLLVDLDFATCLGKAGHLQQIKTHNRARMVSDHVARWTSLDVAHSA